MALAPKFTGPWRVHKILGKSITCRDPFTNELRKSHVNHLKIFIQKHSRFELNNRWHKTINNHIQRNAFFMKKKTSSRKLS